MNKLLSKILVITVKRNGNFYIIKEKRHIK